MNRIEFGKIFEELYQPIIKACYQKAFENTNFAKAKDGLDFFRSFNVKSYNERNTKDIIVFDTITKQIHRPEIKREAIIEDGVEKLQETHETQYDIVFDCKLITAGFERTQVVKSMLFQQLQYATYQDYLNVFEVGEVGNEKTLCQHLIEKEATLHGFIELADARTFQESQRIDYANWQQRATIILVDIMKRGSQDIVESFEVEACSE